MTNPPNPSKKLVIALSVVCVGLGAFALKERFRMQMLERNVKTWDAEMRAINQALPPEEKRALDIKLRFAGWPELANWLQAVNDEETKMATRDASAMSNLPVANE